MLRRALGLILVLTIMYGMFSYASADDLNPFNKLEDLIAIANSFVQRRTGALINTEGTYSGLISNEGAKESYQLWNSESLALSELMTRRNVLRDWGEAYTHSDTALTLLNVTIDNQRVILDFKESSRLFYERINGDEPEYTAWISLRQFIFEKTGEIWELVSQELMNTSGPAPINEPTGTTESQMRNSLNWSRQIRSEESVRDIRNKISNQLQDDHSTMDFSIAGTFNRTASKDYALQYWDNYNPAYRSFPSDCTNFVSQAMRAAGWPYVNGLDRDDPKNWWYNTIPYTQTYSWTGVGYFFDFASIHSKRTYIMTDPFILYPGEVLQVDFQNNDSKDHSMIVTNSTSTDIYLTYHTSDTLNRSLSSLCTAYPNAKWYPHYHYVSY